MKRENLMQHVKTCGKDIFSEIERSEPIITIYMIIELAIEENFDLIVISSHQILLAQHGSDNKAPNHKLFSSSSPRILTVLKESFYKVLNTDEVVRASVERISQTLDEDTYKLTLEY